jgi:hypothetical protein
MAFRFKDLMIQVIRQNETGGDEHVCTIASKIGGEPDPAAVMPCTLASMIDPARVMPCTPATYPDSEHCPMQMLAGQGGGITPAITTVTTVTTVTTLVAGTGRGAADLSSLKQQLRQALDQVEAQERASAAQAPAGLPATMEEAEDLERRLREAVEELQAHKKTLQKPAKPGTKAGKGKK